MCLRVYITLGRPPTRCDSAGSPHQVPSASLDTAAPNTLQLRSSRLYHARLETYIHRPRRIVNAMCGGRTCMSVIHVHPNRWYLPLRLGCPWWSPPYEIESGWVLPLHDCPCGGVALAAQGGHRPTCPSAAAYCKELVELVSFQTMNWWLSLL